MRAWAQGAGGVTEGMLQWLGATQNVQRAEPGAALPGDKLGNMLNGGGARRKELLH